MMALEMIIGYLILRMLSGADINLRSKYPNMPYDGKSPLDRAYESGDAKVVELLLGHGKKH